MRTAIEGKWLYHGPIAVLYMCAPFTQWRGSFHMLVTASIVVVIQSCCTQIRYDLHVRVQIPPFVVCGANLWVFIPLGCHTQNRNSDTFHRFIAGVVVLVARINHGRCMYFISCGRIGVSCTHIWTSDDFVLASHGGCIASYRLQRRIQSSPRIHYMN